LKYRILDPAIADIETARQYYRDTKYWTLLTKAKAIPDGENELSHAFYEEVKRTVKLVAANPMASTEVSPGYFRRHLMRFPYKVIYFIDADELLILAVQHSHMHPDAWHERK